MSTWLGSRYEPIVNQTCDVTLQRSISLETGLELIRYLQSVSVTGSLDSVASSFSYCGSDRSWLQYSIEDIPVSPLSRNRRASLESIRAYFASTLKGSYKIHDRGSVSPKWNRKLSFHWDMSVGRNCENSGGLLDYGNFTIGSTKDKPTFERFLSFDGRKTQNSMRKDVLVKEMMNSNSCDDLFVARGRSISESESTMSLSNVGLGLPKDKRVELGNISVDVRRIKLNMFVSTDVPDNTNLVDSKIECVAKLEDSFSHNTSKSLDLSSDCDCRICRDGKSERDSGSLISRVFRKLFTNVIMKNKDRKLVVWDENNNLNDGEMYKCIMHILKLMLGLWLRHMDHN